VRMPPKTRNRTRREVVDESNAPPQGTHQRGRGRVRGRRGVNIRGRGVNAGRHAFVEELFNVEVPRRRRGNPVVEDANLQGLQQVVQQLVGIVGGQQQGNQRHENFEGQQEVRQVDQAVAAPSRGIAVTLAEFLKLKPPTFLGLV